MHRSPVIAAILWSGMSLAAALACVWPSPAGAQAPPSMECGVVQTNVHIRCKVIGFPAFDRDRRAYWSDVPGKETLRERYLDESDCHADTEARCDQVGSVTGSYSTTWNFDQRLGSDGCEEGATGNGWIDPYLAWRAKIVLPKRSGDKAWLLTIAASTITAATIRAYPDAAVAVASCHLTIMGVGTSKDISIPRGGAQNEQRQTLSGFSPGEYLAELQCPAIQGSECRQGKASLSLRITASPDDR